MREIGLFKGFHESPIGKQIITLDGVDYRGDWICGGYWFSEGRHWIAVDDRTKTNEIGSGSNCVLFKTVCEYIGLTDKNENRIWENDKLFYQEGCFDRHEFIVKYGETGFVGECFPKNKNFISNIISIHHAFDFEVIGDIFNTRSVE